MSEGLIPLVSTVPVVTAPITTVTSAVSTPTLPATIPSFWLAILGLVILGLVAWLIYMYLRPAPQPSTAGTVAALNGVWLDRDGNRVIMADGSGSYVPPIPTSTEFPTAGGFTYTVAPASATPSLTAGNTGYTFRFSTQPTNILGVYDANTRTITFPGNAVWRVGSLTTTTPMGVGLGAVGVTPAAVAGFNLNTITGTWTDTANNATIVLNGPNGGTQGFGTYTYNTQPTPTVQPVSYTFAGGNNYLINLLQLDQVEATLSSDGNTLTLSSPPIDFQATWTRNSS